MTSLLAVAVHSQSLQLGQISANLEVDKNIFRPNLNYEQEDTQVPKLATLHKKEDCSFDGDSYEILEDLYKMEDTGMKEFKSISLMRRELRDWYVKAFREEYYNGNSKSEDASEFTVTDLNADKICLSSKNGYESIKIERQNTHFFPYTIDDKCCRIYSKPEMKGEYADLCLNGEEFFKSFAGWED